MFYELMSTDAEVWRTFARGLVGKHWVWVDKDKNVAGFPAGVDSKKSGYNPNTDWMYSNTFLAPYKSAAQVGSHEETEKGNARAALPMPGPFIFDPKPVSAEMAAMDTVYKQYYDPLYYGLVDPADPKAGIDAWLKAMKDAGLDKVVAEIQKQLDAFVAANPDIFK
jgi:putative aldouronate transport system substrate-binding protein